MADQFSKVKWGDGFTVTDEGAGVIRVDGGGGAPPANSSLMLIAASGWDKVIGSGSLTPIHWTLEDSTLPPNFEDYWEFHDESSEPTDSSEFVYLGMKKWGVVGVSGWISCPSGPPSSDYKRIVTAAVNGGLQFCTTEEWDYRVRNLGFCGIGRPFSSWSPMYELSISFSQESGSSMTLEGSGSYAWCEVMFWDSPRTP
jgi:hypothetical protein